MALNINKYLCINKHCRDIWKDYACPFAYCKMQHVFICYVIVDHPRTLGSVLLVTVQSHLGSEVFIFTPQFLHKSLLHFSTRLPTFF